MKIKLYILVSFFLIQSVATLAQFSYDLKMIEPASYRFLSPGTYTFKATVQNLGLNYVSSLTYNFSINNGPVSSGTVSAFQISNSLWANATDRFIVPYPVTFSAPGDYIMKAWCSNLNGFNQDQDHSNDTVSQVIHVLNYVPPKQVMIDYYAHTTCGPCGSQGSPWVDSMIAHYPSSAHRLSIHHQNAPGDPFVTSQSSQLDWNMNVLAHPTIYYDRFLFPYFSDLQATVSYIYWTPWRPVGDRLEYPEPVEVTVKNVQYNSVTRQLFFDVQADFYYDYNDSLAFNAYIVEDSILFYQAGAPDPNNYWHRRIFRKSLGDVLGIPGSIPFSVPAGTSLTFSFADTLQTNFNVNQVYIYGLVQHQSSNYQKRQIINMNALRLSDVLTGIHTVENNNSNELMIYPNVSSGYIFIRTQPDSKNKTRLEIISSDGKRTVIYPSYPGQEEYEINISGFAQGIYQVILESESKVFTKKFVKIN
jgi:type IX secretion system substrate protein